jgi:hypothetical protein
VASLGGQRVGHTFHQRVGNVVLAAVGDDPTELGLEAVGPDTRTAQVEVPGDLQPPLLGELTVEIRVETLDGLVAPDESGQL